MLSIFFIALLSGSEPDSVSIRERSAFAHYTNAVIGKFEMRAGQVNLRHVATGAIILANLTGTGAAVITSFDCTRFRLQPLLELMTGQTLRIVKGRALLQAVMRIVTGRAADAFVGGITAAVEHSIRLEANVADAAAIGQRHYIFDAAMATAAHILGHVIAIQIAQLFYLCLCCRLLACFHQGNMVVAGAVTRFATNARGQMGQTGLRTGGNAGRRASGVTAKTTFRFIQAHLASRSFCQCLRGFARITQRDIQPTDLPVKADSAFIHRAVIFKNVGLSGFALPETIKNRQREF